MTKCLYTWLLHLIRSTSTNINQGLNVLVYLRHRSFGVNDNGSLSLQTTFVASQPDTVQSCPEPSLDSWEETVPSEPYDPSFEIVDSIQMTTVTKKRIQVCILKYLGYQANVGQNVPLLQWIPERSSFLDEMIRLEGCGDEIPRGTCSCKGEEPLLYCCQDCFGVEMVCRACILQWHVHNPLHRVEVRSSSISLSCWTWKLTCT